MRRIRLPDLLIEVDNELNFTGQFLPPAQRETATAEEICLVLAAIVAHGCNIGPYTMAQMTSGLSYEQIKRVADWQLTPEAQRSALAVLVNAISDLNTSLYWGEGRTSASDGQRFSMRRKVLQQTYKGTKRIGVKLWVKLCRKTPGTHVFRHKRVPGRFARNYTLSARMCAGT